MDPILPERVTVPSDVLFQSLDSECVLMHMGREQFFGLDDVGARMWTLLAETGEPAAALRRLCAEYAADEATLRRDLAGLIEKLTAEGLLRAHGQ